MISKNWISLILLFGCVVHAHAQLYASVSDATVPINHSFTIEFWVNEEVDQLITPKFEDFEIINGPSQSVSNTYIDGQHSYKKSIQYTLKPTQLGIYTISNATASMGEKTIKSNVLHVQVIDASPILSSEEKAIEKARQHVYYIADIDADTLRLGQTTTLRYRIYVNQDLWVNSWEPSLQFEGTGVRYEKIPIASIEVENTIFKEQNFRRVTIFEYVLEASQIGASFIKPRTLDISVGLPDPINIDFFGNTVVHTVSFELSTEPIEITVLPQE